MVHIHARTKNDIFSCFKLNFIIVNKFFVRVLVRVSHYSFKSLEYHISFDQITKLFCQIINGKTKNQLKQFFVWNVHLTLSIAKREKSKKMWKQEKSFYSSTMSAVYNVHCKEHCDDNIRNKFEVYELTLSKWCCKILHMFCIMHPSKIIRFQLFRIHKPNTVYF